jgi:hypothetical protein
MIEAIASRMQPRVCVAVFVSLCFLAFVAPIPAKEAAEFHSALRETETTRIQDIEPGEIIAIELRHEIQERCNHSIIDVLGSAVVSQDGELTAELTVHARVFDERGSLISNDTTDCTVTISEYERMRMLLSSETDELNQDSAFIPAYEDWGTFSTYYWRGRKFVARPGNDKTPVSYDHPDNYYTYHREQWNLHWDMYDTPSKTSMIHLAWWEVQDALRFGYLTPILGGMASLIGVAVGVLAGVLAGIIVLFFATIIAFIGMVVQAEQGDGWEYVCGPGDYPYTGWWWVSFGYWRDIWWVLQF